MFEILLNLPRLRHFDFRPMQKYGPDFKINKGQGQSRKYRATTLILYQNLKNFLYLKFAQIEMAMPMLAYKGAYICFTTHISPWPAIKSWWTRSPKLSLWP